MKNARKILKFISVGIFYVDLIFGSKAIGQLKLVFLSTSSAPFPFRSAKNWDPFAHARIFLYFTGLERSVLVLNVRIPMNQVECKRNTRNIFLS